MNTQLRNHKNQNGAAMLSIVLIIVIILIAMIGALSLGPRLKNITYERQTVQRGSVIVDALKQHYLARGELPPPESVPVEALNLEQKYKLDSWGQEWKYYRAESGGEPDITGMTVDGQSVAAVLISYGPNQRPDYLTSGDTGCASDYCSNDDDIIIPINVQGEAIQIAKDELTRLSRFCPVYSDDLGLSQPSDVIEDEYSLVNDWSEFLLRTGLGTAYRNDPWMNESVNQEYIWESLENLTSPETVGEGRWVTLGSASAGVQPMYGRTFRCDYLKGYEADDNGENGITGNTFNFATMDSGQIANFIASTISPDKTRWDAAGGDLEKDKTIGDVVLRNINPWAWLYIPILDENNCGEYIIRSVARLDPPVDNLYGGYGIFFDTKLSGTDPDPGFVFQFDRGLADGELTINKRQAGESRLERYFDRVYLPTRDDPWWSSLHYVQLRVTNTSSGQNNRNIRATVYDLKEPYEYNMDTVFDFYFGPWRKRLSFDHDYDVTISGEQLYTGYRGWHRSTYFHYLSVDFICPIDDNGTETSAIVLCVREDGTLKKIPFGDEISLPNDDCLNHDKLVITSEVGTQLGDTFLFRAPEGVYIESGVFIGNEGNNEGVIIIESENGDVIIEEGVVFETDTASNKEREEIYIKAGGDIDIRGLNMTARRYIYLEAGGNIFAQNARLETTTNASQTGIYFEAANIYIDNICIKYGNNGKVVVVDGTLTGIGSSDGACNWPW